MLHTVVHHVLESLDRIGLAKIVAAIIILATLGASFLNLVTLPDGALYGLLVMAALTLFGDAAREALL